MQLDRAKEPLMPVEKNLPQGGDFSARAGVVSVNATFDDGAVDRFVRCVSEAGDKTRLIIDATQNRWLSPEGLVSLFTVGDWLREQDSPKPQLLLPRNAEALAYWSRMGVARYAGDYFDVRGDLRSYEERRDGPLVEVTKLGPGADCNGEQYQSEHLIDRIACLLRDQLGLGARMALTTLVELAEIASEMKDESGGAVWFSAQTFFWRAKLGRRVLLCALGCHGYRPRTALEEQYAGKYGSRWDDATALEAALLQGVSRFSPDRPRGLGALRRVAMRLDGKLTIRSGTARISVVPSWDQVDPLVTDLPEYPGTLLTLTTPAQGTVGQ
jgi:hypothetical protein